jgi:hypothetical protein
MPTGQTTEYNQMLTTPALAETVGEPKLITGPADPVMSQWLQLSEQSTTETKVWTNWQNDPYQRKLNSGTVPD